MSDLATQLEFGGVLNKLEARVVKALADLGFTYYHHPVPAPRLQPLLLEN